MTDIQHGEAQMPEPGESGIPRTAGLPENFETVEALAAAHKAAQQRITELSTGAAQEAAQTPENPSVGESGEDAGAQNAAPSPFTPFFEHFAENGELTDEQYDQLDAMGLNRGVVNDYIESKNIATSSRDADIVGGIGGQEAFNTYAEWAGKSLSEAQVAKINEDLSSGDITVAKFAAASLKAAYEASNGASPNAALTGQSPSSIGAKPFYDEADFQAAMSDPKYAKDETYRQEVRRRLENSPELI